MTTSHDLTAALLIAAVLALAGCGGGGGGGGAPVEVPTPPPESPAAVTGTTPYQSGCDGVAASGTLFINAEVEPMIAVNPRDANHLVGVWQQDRWSSGGARGLRTGASLDNGATWQFGGPAFSRCSGGNAANGGDFQRASDPWVSFGPDGTVHQIALAFSGGSFQPNSSNAILASRSTDGGRTWSAPVPLIADDADHFNDKESITADPTDARLVYAVWDRLGRLGGGPAYFVRSTDGGLSWEQARPIFDPGPASQTINNQIVVLPDGTLIAFFTRIQSLAPSGPGKRASLALVRSFDQGLTWSDPVEIAAAQPVGTEDPTTGAPVRDGALLGAFAAGTRGELVAVWQDSRFSAGERDGIAFSKSLDGGLTWTAPVQVNSDPSVAAFVPSVTVRVDGTIGVAYYDFRADTTDLLTLPTDYWLAQSTDGVTWTESHVAGPFNLTIAPNAGGYFLGDYQGLATAGDAFVPLFARTNDGDLVNRTDIYAMLVRAAAAAKAAPAGAIPRAAMRARAAPELEPTPALRERLSSAVTRVLQGRLPGASARERPATPPR